MLRQRARMLVASLVAADLVVLLVAALLAYWLREVLLPAAPGVLLPLASYAPVIGAMLVSWLGLLAYFGLYRSFRTKPLWAQPLALLKVAAVATLLTGAVTFGFKMQFVSRLYIGIFGGLALALLVAERSWLRTLARRVRRDGYNTRNVILVGSGRRVRDIAHVLQENRQWGLRLLGVVYDYETGFAPRGGDLPVLGHLQQLPDILKTHVVDEVIFSVSRKKLEDLAEVFLYCEELGVRAHVAVNFFPHMISKIHLDKLGSVPLLTFTTTPYNEFLLLLKRAFDLVASSVLIVLLSPVILATAIAIKLTSRGPVFFKQTRVGLNGRRFTLYKFRSMVADAEARKAELLHLNEMAGPVFKIKNDPRLTPIGKFLRRTSLDELPQLFNVLQGTMSIVGPRPPVPDEVQQYRSWQRRRLSMKPGITCLWQVNGRNSIVDFDKWMELDLQYIDNWSLKLDLSIFVRTIPAVLLRKGAA